MFVKAPQLNKSFYSTPILLIFMVMRFNLHPLILKQFIGLKHLWPEGVAQVPQHTQTHPDLDTPFLGPMWGSKVERDISYCPFTQSWLHTKLECPHDLSVKWSVCKTTTLHDFKLDNSSVISVSQKSNMLAKDCHFLFNFWLECH